MTDDLYTLYLDVFTMKLSGVDCAALADLRAKSPTMQQRAVVALALADAGLGVARARADLASGVAKLLEVE